jgi:DNA polymerase-1
MLIHPLTQTCREEHNWDDELLNITMDLAAARGMVLNQVAEWEEQLDCDAGTSILCFTGGSNWRKEIDPSYKSHRKGPKPPGFKELVEWCHRIYDCRIWAGLEADDVCGILCTQMTELPPEKRWILVSGDKDMATIPGYQWDFNRDEIGKVRYQSPLEADRFHMKQALMGDRTDGYPGCPGVGPKGADKLLDEAESLEEMWTEVVKAFESKGLTEEDALRNARLAYILRDGDWNTTSQEVRQWTPTNK